MHASEFTTRVGRTVIRRGLDLQTNEPVTPRFDGLAAVLQHFSKLSSSEPETTSFAISLLIHIAVLFALALILPESPNVSAGPLALTFPREAVEELDVSLEPLVEIDLPLPEVVGDPQPEQQAVGIAATNEALSGSPPALSEDVVPVPESFTFGEMLQPLPDAAVLLTEVALPNSGVGGAGRSSSFGAGDGDGEGGTSFFGVRASGQTVIYVVDCSSSMQGAPLEKLKSELAASIKELPAKCKFMVLFFNSGAIVMDGQPRLLQASEENKQKTLTWIETIPAEGGTDPSTALGAALNLRPSVIFLMTDGQFMFPFPADVMAMLSRAPRTKTRVNTIAFGEQAATAHLQAIANSTRGTFAFVRLAGP